MGYQPWYTGQVYPPIQISLNVERVPDNIALLSSSNLAMVIRNIGVNPATDANGTGTFIILSNSPAVITYQFSSGDVTTAGTYELIIKATFPGPGGGQTVYDPIPFVLSAI